jgi:hypothetical protein
MRRMPHFVLVHDGVPIALPEGETVVGRGLSCDIRFNDPSVSREHVRIVVLPGHAAAANLSARGTTINGHKLEGPRRLREGDVLGFGHQKVVLQVADGPLPAAAPPHAIAEKDAHRTTDQVDVIDASATNRAPPLPSRLAEIVIDMCPRCRARVPEIDDECAACGYTWPVGHPSARTREVPIGASDRKEPRYRISLPVIYASGTLTIHATVRDVSRGGMFVETNVLDPVGTPCEVTVLPDGYRALRLSGYVAHVAGNPTLEHRCGLGIQIVSGSPEGRNWLERTIALLARGVRG